MLPFIYHVPTKVYFGENQLEHLGPELAQFGQRVLLVYGGGSIKKTGLYDRVLAALDQAGLQRFELAGIDPNPRLESINEGAALCKREQIDVLLPVGGGSVIDAAKVIAAAAHYAGDAWDLVTRKAPVTACLPVVSILTLAAAGSEMDPAGVVSNLATNEKIGLIHPLMRPQVSFLDPTNTYTVNTYQTACGAADIMSHIMEVYFTHDQDLYMLDYFMEGLLKTVVKFAPVAMAEPTNYEARANLMWASSWAINGFITGGKRKAWSCHPMEHELSAFYDITHGLGLAILTPRWLQYILDADTAPKIKQFGCHVFGVDESLPDLEAAQLAIDKLAEFFFQTLGLSSTLRAIGIDESKLEQMAEKACKGQTLPGFKPLTQEDIAKIYQMCL